MLTRGLAVGSALGLLLLAGLCAVAGELLSRPANGAVGAPPPDLDAEVVHLRSASGATVAGWFARGTPGTGAVLLLHGVRADRRSMLDRARFLKRAGYAVLLIDLPAHGESSGERISFGHREAAGVRAALDHLRSTLPGERIGVIGVSLGAASALFARPQPAPSALVLEAMYPTIAEAVSARLALRFGPLGRVAAPLLLWQMPWRLGIRADDLRPIVELDALTTPLLIAAGTDDRHTTWAETERLFAAANAPKQLWAVPGAAHVDLHAHDRAAYEATVLRFLAEHLRP